MRKLIAFTLVGALALASTGASCGGSVKDSAGKAVVAAEAAYHVVVEAELALRCGQPTAIVGHCISAEDHARYKALLLQVYNPGPPPTGFLKDAKDIYALLPTSGTPDTSQLLALVSKIGEIIQGVLNGLPPSAQATSATADSSVQKTISAATKGGK